MPSKHTVPGRIFRDNSEQEQAVPKTWHTDSCFGQRGSPRSTSASPHRNARPAHMPVPQAILASGLSRANSGHVVYGGGVRIIALTRLRSAKNCDTGAAVAAPDCALDWRCPIIPGPNRRAQSNAGRKTHRIATSPYAPDAGLSAQNPPRLPPPLSVVSAEDASGDLRTDRTFGRF